MYGINKLIVLNGLERGGTSITWNLLQSHPNIISPMHEINQIQKYKQENKTQYKLNLLAVRGHLNILLIKSKLKTLFVKSKDTNGKYVNNSLVSNDHIYPALCIKGVCSPYVWDLNSNNSPFTGFEENYSISLVRDGFSICESWMRRGISPQQAGYLYAKFCDQILDLTKKDRNSLIIRFEDVLEDPFRVAEQLFTFVSEEPVSLNKLRFKVKKTLSENGSYRARFGKENTKYWVDRNNVFDLIDKKVDTNQQSHLSRADKEAFQREAFDALQYFGYLN